MPAPIGPVAAGWMGLILLGYLVGVITGLFGIGGGFLLTPSLKIIFNIAYPAAIGSSLLQIFCTSVLAAYKHWQNKNLDTKMGAITVTSSLIGTEGGVQLLRLFNAQGSVAIRGHSILLTDLLVSLCYLLLLIPVAVFMYREACASNQKGLSEPDTVLGHAVRKCPWPPFTAFKQSDIPRLSVWMPIMLSVSVGLFTGLLGVGGGFISFPLLVYALRMPTKTAVGTSTVMVLLASGYGSLRYMQAGNVNFQLVLFLLAGSILGVNTGVKLAGKIGSCHTRKYFSGLMVLAIVLIACDLFKRLIL